MVSAQDTSGQVITMAVIGLGVSAILMESGMDQLWEAMDYL